MSVPCPAGSICPKEPIKTSIGGKDYYTFTATKVIQGSDGKVTGGETTLYYSPSPNNYYPAAKTKDGAKNWEYLTYQSGQSIPNGKKVGDTILGAAAQKSLQEGALKTNTNNSLSDATRRANIPPEQAKNLNLNNKTQETVPEVTAQQISDSTAAKETGGTRDEFIGKGGNNPLKYPIKLNNDHQDVIKFSMVKYSPKNYSSKDFGFGERNEQRDIIGVVVLPVPSGISDMNSVSWSGAEMNAAQAMAANIAMTTIGEGVSEGVDAIASAAEKISENYKDVATAIKAAFVNAAVGTNGILTRTTGLILNPNMELLFNSPTLRPFDFSFKLSARSKEEAQAIRSIIRFFKQGMSPIRTESNLFLKSPHTFQLEYLHKGQSHPFLNKFKECALTSFSVDYTPEGQYATFSDGAMVSYQIRMQFQELEPVFNDEYTQGAGSTGYDVEIGY